LRRAPGCGAKGISSSDLVWRSCGVDRGRRVTVLGRRAAVAPGPKSSRYERPRAVRRSRPDATSGMFGASGVDADVAPVVDAEVASGVSVFSQPASACSSASLAATPRDRRPGPAQVHDRHTPWVNEPRSAIRHTSGGIAGSSSRLRPEDRCMPFIIARPAAAANPGVKVLGIARRGRFAAA